MKFREEILPLKVLTKLSKISDHHMQLEFNPFFGTSLIQYENPQKEKRFSMPKSLTNFAQMLNNFQSVTEKRFNEKCACENNIENDIE